MNPELETSAEAYAFIEENKGAMCEVMTVENETLLAGSAGEYDSKQQRLRVNTRGGEKTPKIVGPGLRVKVGMRSKTVKGQAALFYGTVIQCTTEFWVIQLEEVVQYMEGRENFRQPLHAEGYISRKRETEKHPCRTVDISLTGVGLQCQEEYAMNEEVILSGIRVVPGGRIYTFLCEIVRSEEESLEDGSKCRKYGCRLLDMTDREQDILCRDILALQARGLRGGNSRREDQEAERIRELGYQVEALKKEIMILRRENEKLYKSLEGIIQ